MMKFRYLIIILIMTFILPTSVLAVGDVSVSSSNINVVKGGTSSFVITATNSAGRVDIKSSNPGVVSVSQTSVFLDMNSSTILINGNSLGNAIITVYVSDATTYDDEDLSGKSYTINVNVSEPVVNQNKKLSDNNNVKSITVEGYELEKISEKEFNLSVLNSVASVNVNAVLDDKKASVSGDGVRELNVGENIIEIIVTSESGKENKYVLNITRNKGLQLEELTSSIGNLAEKNINVKIEADSILSSDILKKIKDSGKQVSLNYSDENNKLLYSWIIDGNKIDKTNEFLTSVSYISEYKEDIEKLTNYAEGLYVNIKNNNKLPEGSIIKLHVGDKYDNDDMVKLYCYNPNNNNLQFISDRLYVKAKYIEFEVDNCSNYFVTKSNVKGASNNFKSLNIFLIIGIVVAIVAFSIIFILVMKKKKDNNVKKVTFSNNSVNEVNNNDNLGNINNVNKFNNNVINNTQSNSFLEKTSVDSVAVDNVPVESKVDNIEIINNIDDAIDIVNKENSSIIVDNSNVEIHDNVVNSSNENISNEVLSFNNYEDKNVTFGGFNIDLEDNNNGNN